MEVIVDHNCCIECGLCILACKFDAITLPLTVRKAVIDEEKCKKCKECIDACPLGCIDMEEEHG